MSRYKTDQGKMAASLNGTGSSGSNGSDGDGKSPNDRKGHLSPKSQRQKQEEFDALRRREEGMQLLKLFRVQKWFLSGLLSIWKLIVIGKECEMMRVRVFEYPNIKVYEFSDLRISHLKVLSNGRFRGNKLYFVHHQGRPPIVNEQLTVHIACRGMIYYFWREL